MSNYQDKADLLKVLAHPTRIKVIEELITRGTCSVNELVNIINIPQSTVSQHLAKLKSQKIVVDNRKGIEVYYRVQKSKVISILELLLDKKSNIIKIENDF
ncbi:ArsR/SmtB family transcription factor [Bacillus cereus]|uniref:ArsR/SmtB family transcription factor n=1 Tax=Bacillus cereus TaxID=1396 RepID=UPI000BF45049|nr:metalloregulator ArsR/SmtB family transcription factor [Bacillus cereus]PFO90336.1 transcriptional regulator [Bacillus cereus]